MNKQSFSIAVFAAAFLLLGAGCATEKTPEPTPITEEAPQAITHPVTYNPNGLTPKEVTISVGDSIEFRNSDLKSHWPASAPHPTHSDYPEFDAKKELAPGDVWQFKFTKPGTWKFHDHLTPTNAGFQGTIIVK